MEYTNAANTLLF